MRVRLSTAASASLLWCALVLASVAPAVAADTPTPLKGDNVSMPSAPVIAEPAPLRLALASGQTSGTVRQDPRNISLDFHAADIADVLKALAVQSGANIVTGTDVKGQVTVSLNHVSLHEALDMVTKLSGYRYALVPPDTYVVGTVPGVSGVTGEGALETVSETVSIRYADPEQLAKVLAAQVPGLSYSSSGGKADQPGPKVLVLSGTKAVVDTAKTLVQKVEDTLAVEAAGRTVEVYKMKYLDAKTAAVSLTSVLPRLTVTVGPTTGFNERAPSGVTFMTAGGAGGGGAAQGSEQQKEEPRTLILSGTAEDVAKAKEILAGLDTKPKQVLIEAKVTDITLDAQKRLGITWQWTNFTFSEGTKPSGAGDSHFHRLPMSAEGQLDAMLKDNSARLLANPTIAAVEGKPATIFIGDEIKYIVSIQQTLTGITYQTETANVGVTLRVVARPDDDGYVTLALHPEVSVISDFLRIGTGTGGNNATSAIVLPQIARRFTDHVIRVKAGDTIAIGGLIRDTELNNLTKVPLLGDLPFLGGLFRHRERQKQHSEIAIFLKASLMPDS